MKREKWKWTRMQQGEKSIPYHWIEKWFGELPRFGGDAEG
jgi:hypothetical protein